MNIFDDMYEYRYEYETQDLRKFDIFVSCFWLILGLGSLLTEIAFIILKLFGIISWAWWIILSPIWGFTGLITLIVCFVALGIWISELINKIKCHKKCRKEKDRK